MVFPSLFLDAFGGQAEVLAWLIPPNALNDMRARDGATLFGFPICAHKHLNRVRGRLALRARRRVPQAGQEFRSQTRRPSEGLDKCVSEIDCWPRVETSVLASI